MPTSLESRHFSLSLLLIGLATLIGRSQTGGDPLFTPQHTPKANLAIERYFPERISGTHFYTDTLPERAREYSTSVDESFTIERLEEMEGRTPADKAAWKDLDRGYMLWKNGNRSAAVRKWRHIVVTQPGKEVAYDAQFNIAEAAQSVGDYPAAVRELTGIIDGPSSGSVDKMNSDWTIKFNKQIACLRLSDLCLDHDDLPSALKYADLALNKYPPSGFCGVCVQMERAHLQNHISCLRSAIGNSVIPIASN
ncbi:MAG: hypothetical protein KDA68_13515 [Planctomycetaceae bacterium]|nr:hypothetical protein [Planctomycetaceae bacterium]